MNYFVEFTQPGQQPNNQQQPSQQLFQPVHVSKELTEDMMKAQTRNIEAQARIAEANAKAAEASAKMMEAQILLNGMQELRMALHIPTVDEDQPSMGDHPKLRPMFAENQIEQLQLHYLVAYKKYEDFSGELIQKYRDESTTLPQ